MTSRLTFAALAAVLAGSAAMPALAHQGHKEHAQAAVPQSAEGTGVVRAMDAKASTVTLAHDPITALKWPAMTMKFRVQSAGVLNGVAVGRKVHFVLRNDNGKPVVAAIHPL